MQHFFIKNNLATYKTNEVLVKILLLWPAEYVQRCRCNVFIQ